MQEYELSAIKETVRVRKLNKAFVEHLKSEFKSIGFQKANPVSITIDGVLWDGNHRLQAVKELGWESIPAVIETPENIRRAAHERNRASQNALPETFVDHAEEIWQLLSTGKTQQQVADELGWSRAQVSQYASLDAIDKGAWEIIATAVTKNLMQRQNGDVADNATPVAFSENLLRAIIPLKAEQQVKLVKQLAKGTIDKKQFKQSAETLKTCNAIDDYIADQLADTSDDHIKACQEQADKSIYIDEWVAEGKQAGPKLAKLIGAFLDDWAATHSYSLIEGDFRTVSKQIDDASVDFVITDPPYGKEHLPLYADLAAEAKRVLKNGGSLLCMVGGSYLPEIITMFSEHLNYHWVVAYLTPGGQASQIWERKVNTFWKPILWFKNGGAEIDKWIGDVCKSAVNDNDKRFHQWGQSESGMSDIVERFTEPGDLIFDPFMGGGTTGVVSLSLNRKFIGIDQNKATFEAAAKRIKETINGKK